VLASPDREQILALAAVFQSLAGVRQLAERGQRATEDNQVVLQGLIGEWQGSTEQLYGGIAALETGLRQLVDHLSQPSDAQLTRYLVAVMQLERRLRRNGAHLQAVGQGLSRAREQAEYFGANDHASVIHHLAQLYSDQISSLRPRILVQGTAGHLQDDDNQALIRALLMAAIRAAGLWRAAGGGRLQLVVRRQALVEGARALISRS